MGGCSRTFSQRRSRAQVCSGLHGHCAGRRRRHMRSSRAWAWEVFLQTRRANRSQGSVTEWRGSAARGGVIAVVHVTMDRFAIAQGGTVDLGPPLPLGRRPKLLSSGAPVLSIQPIFQIFRNFPRIHKFTCTYVQLTCSHALIGNPNTHPQKSSFFPVLVGAQHFFTPQFLRSTNAQKSAGNRYAKQKTTTTTSTTTTTITTATRKM